MLMVRMQNKQEIQRPLGNRVRFIILARRSEHHTQQVAAISQIVLWINDWFTDVVLIAESRDSRHLGD